MIGNPERSDVVSGANGGEATALGEVGGKSWNAKGRDGGEGRPGECGEATALGEENGGKSWNAEGEDAREGMLGKLEGSYVKSGVNGGRDVFFEKHGGDDDISGVNGGGKKGEMENALNFEVIEKQCLDSSEDIFKDIKTNGEADQGYLEVVEKSEYDGRRDEEVEKNKMAQDENELKPNFDEKEDEREYVQIGENVQKLGKVRMMKAEQREMRSATNKLNVRGRF